MQGSVSSGNSDAVGPRGNPIWTYGRPTGFQLCERLQLNLELGFGLNNRADSFPIGTGFVQRWEFPQNILLFGERPPNVKALCVIDPQLTE